MQIRIENIPTHPQHKNQCQSWYFTMTLHPITLVVEQICHGTRNWTYHIDNRRNVAANGLWVELSSFEQIGDDELFQQLLI